MNKDDREALLEFLYGTFPFLLVIVLFAFFVLTLENVPQEPSQPRVVDKVEGCDIIRWEDPSGRYHYFANCYK